MMVREYRPSDLDNLKEIHSKYFKDEFVLPNFLSNYLCAVTVEDNQGLITVGGIRNIAEVVAVTNKTKTVRIRREALLALLQALGYVARQFNHNQIHAFIQDPIWKQQLIRTGFNPTKGDALVLEL